MSLFSAMRSGVSGMSAQSSRMAAISDNISNSATVGYKRADVQFSTLLTSPSRENYSAGGVQSHTFFQVQKDGTIQGTQSSTDMAIQGDGFFVVADRATAALGTPERALTRAGSFLPDAEGYLRNSAGNYLQGWKLNPDGSLPAVNLSAFTDLSAINVANLAYGGSPTSHVDFSGNLPGQAAIGTTFDTTTTIYDGQGTALDLKLTWKALGNDKWELNATLPTDNDTPPAPYTFAPTSPAMPLTVDFAQTGPNAGMPITPIPNLSVLSPAKPVSDTIAVTFPNVTQLNGDYVPQVTGDGSKAGMVSAVNIDTSGKLWAIYDNGARRALYQIPVADVTNPDGLVPQDGNTYTLGADSGNLTLNIGNAGGIGSVIGNALEQSNVDLADEMVSLIETQRAYSSSATIVRTIDEMVDETTRLKR
ncbi:flagellar hook protein FlgE [Azospirillum sp. TSO22-1]|uniref:flagellar hook protein FlgE n=1 Tax=Azospirillum sp. TSO22-1 TaxID=716789 RepID=UPI000D60F874|nr:flagellar hook protein FlgE [Azospirillum sp. TSO22-1]PWC42576.1 flagellar hook protein [Azospirillum sp. TSO22-1]